MLGLFSWTGLARLVRAEVLTLREREYVDAARVAGASTRRIIFKHILPNTVGTIVVSTTLLMGGGILTEAALSFLGFGIQAPNVSLGTLVFDYQGAFSSRPWLFVFPGLFIVTIVLCLQFIGDGLRDAFDPRQKRIPKFKDLERERLEQASVDTSRAGGYLMGRSSSMRCDCSTATVGVDISEPMTARATSTAPAPISAPVDRRDGRDADRVDVVERTRLAHCRPASAHQLAAAPESVCGRSPGRISPPIAASFSRWVFACSLTHHGPAGRRRRPGAVADASASRASAPTWSRCRSTHPTAPRRGARR